MLLILLLAMAVVVLILNWYLDYLDSVHEAQAEQEYWIGHKNRP